MNTTHDYVMVKVIRTEKTEGGLYVPTSVETDAQKGEVIGVGPGMVTMAGNRVPVSVQVGDLAHFSKHGILFKVKKGEDELIILRDKDIFAWESTNGTQKDS
jgi:chaperonin GroES